MENKLEDKNKVVYSIDELKEEINKPIYKSEDILSRIIIKKFDPGSYKIKNLEIKNTIIEGECKNNQMIDLKIEELRGNNIFLENLNIKSIYGKVNNILIKNSNINRIKLRNCKKSKIKNTQTEELKLMNIEKLYIINCDIRISLINIFIINSVDNLKLKNSIIRGSGNTDISFKKVGKGIIKNCELGKFNRLCDSNLLIKNTKLRFSKEDLDDLIKNDDNNIISKDENIIDCFKNEDNITFHKSDNFGILTVHRL